MRSDIQIVLGNKTIEFSMDLDPTDMRDTDMRSYLANNLVPEPEVVHLMMRAIKPGDTVIDGGANLGYFTLLLSRLVGPSGHVIAIEPSPPNLAKLRHNLEINKIQNVEVVAKALWPKSGEALPFYLTEYGGYDSLFSHDKVTGTVEVETITLRDVILQNIVPALIKLDIEGAEVEVLQCGFRPGLFVIAEAHETSIEILRTVMAGHDTYVLHPDGSLPSWVPADCKLVPKAENSNLLFSRMSYVAQAWPEVLY